MDRKTKEIERIWENIALVVDDPQSEIALLHSTIPWKWLWDIDSESIDFQTKPEEKSLIHKMKGKIHELSAAKREFIPDLNIGLNYKYREIAGNLKPPLDNLLL